MINNSLNISYYKLRVILTSLSLAAVLCLQGCAQINPSPNPYPPLPNALENQVQLPGLPNVRGWGDTSSKTLELSAAQSFHQEMATTHGYIAPVINGLVLSGGGEDGAFGAGLLCGWTKSGTRPSFKVVTGISTGALMATFAFLGPAYDNQLRVAYTTVSDQDIYQKHSKFAIILSLANIRPLPSVADDKPLENLIDRLITPQVLADVAKEQLKGRRLLVGTTQLYAQRLVIWDMGAIATSGSPQALETFRKVLLASASIPVTFPPQYFTVEAGGQNYSEMHVDGGVQAELMLFENALQPFSVQRKRLMGYPRTLKLFIIRNQRVYPRWEATQPQIKYMAMRAIDSLIKSQGVADLYRLYAYAQRDQIDYNVSYIPADFQMTSATDFNNAYMRILFERGYQMGLTGNPWHKYPPGFEPGNS